MQPYLVTAIFSLFGGVLGAICTYLLTRRRTNVEIEKVKAETAKINLESQKLSTEMRAPLGNRLNDAFIGPATPDLEKVSKGTREELEQFSGKLTGKTPIILTLALGKGNGFYEAYALRNYVNFLSTYPLFKGVVIIDEHEKFLAYFPRRAMVRLFDFGNDAYDLINNINSNQRAIIPHFAGAVTTTFSRGTTTVDALRTMLRSSLESAVVVDQQDRVSGIIDRENLVGNAILALAS
jgi:CBS domain-containing protein